MNANMKRLLIFALVPVTVWGIGSTFTKQKIDRIGVNTESQITIEDTTRFSSGTASTVPYLDASKDLVSSSVTPTELGYLSGVTSSIQTQIDSIQTPASGAGGSRLNLLDDSSFESGVANGSCTGCTATQDTTNYLATPNNEASLKMAFSAASGNYTWTESTSAQYSNVAGVVSAWIKTSASDCHFDELVDGTQSQTVAIGSSDEWKQYIINGTTGTTSYGWRVRCDTAITDDVFVDETFAGAAEPDVFDIGTASLWGSVKWDTTTTCEFSNSSSTFANYGQDLDCDDNARTIKGQYNSTNGSAGNSDGSYPQIKFSYIPAGILKCEARGFFYAGATGVQFAHRFSDGTISSTNSTSYSSGGSNDLSGANYVEGSLTYDTPQTNVVINLQAKVTSNTGYIQLDNNGEEFEISCYHYPSPQKVVAAKCDGLECVNEFSAKISDAGTVTDENVDWISGNCSTDAGTGQFDCTLTESTMNLNCTIGAQESSAANVTLATQLTNAGAGTLRYRTLNSSSTSAGLRNTVVNCQRSGSDYKQFDQRMVRVIQEEDGDNWTAYTPTFEGLGTVSNIDVQWKRDGDSIKVRGSVTSGTTTATPLTISLPNGYTIDDTVLRTDLNLNGVGWVQRIDTAVGPWYDGNSGVIFFDGSETSKLYVAASTHASNTAYTKRNGSSFLGTGNSIDFKFEVPIAGLKKDVNAFIGNLTPKEFVQTPGSTKPVLYSYKFGGSGVNDSCTASPCSIKRNIGNLVTSVTRTGAGSYQATLDTTKFTSLNCTCAAHQGGISGDRGCGVYDNEGGGFSPMNIYTFAGITGTDTSVMVICHGVQ